MMPLSPSEISKINSHAEAREVEKYLDKLHNRIFDENLSIEEYREIHQVMVKLMEDLMIFYSSCSLRLVVDNTGNKK